MAMRRKSRANHIICLACGQSRWHHARGLCTACWHVRRSEFPKLPRLIVPCDGPGASKARRPPAEPTDAPPGSERKIAALEARFARGEHLWHPQDNLMLSDRAEWPKGDVVNRPYDKTDDFHQEQEEDDE